MRKLVLAIMMLLAIGIIGSFFFSNNAFSIGPKQTINETREVDGAGISSVEAGIDIGDITLEQSPDDQIHVELQGKLSRERAEKLNFDVEEDGENLSVTVDMQKNGGFSIFSWFDFDFNSNGTVDLTIQLPEKEYASIEITSNIGDITVHEVQTQQLTTESDIGDTNLDRTASEEAVLMSNIGDINVNSGAGAFEMETDTGEITLDMETISENIWIRSNVGDVEVNVKEQPDQVVLDLSSDVGDISVENFEGIADTSGRDVSTEIGQGGPTVKIETDVGEIEVKRN